MKLPIVAIIGRPNVGKSTLLNRIVRRREAIVDDSPGITRDRKYADTEWTGCPFTLVDTGGFVSQTSDTITVAVREQILKAIEEATVLLFVVDVTTGITPMDQEIAAIVQKSGKPSLLVVNKVDNEKREQQAVEFYQLGLSEFYPISAISGRGIGDLLDAVVGHLPEIKLKEKEKIIKLAVIGKPNVGKSSYVNAILGQKKVIVTEIPGTTRDAIDLHFRYYNQDFILIDTAGLRKRTQIRQQVDYYSALRTLKSIEKCDVALIFIDAVEGLTHQDLAVVGEAVQQKKGIVLVVNKWDLVEKDAQTIVRYEAELRNRLKDWNFVPILFISCKTKQRIYNVINVAKSVYEERLKRIPTARLNEVLGPIIRDNPPLIRDGKLFKIHYVTQLKTEPPLFAFFSNRPQRIGKNYRRFLEKKIRENFGFLGVPITLVFRQK